MNLHSPSVAVVGATGAVGAEMLGCLERRGFPLSRLRLFASERSAGRVLRYRDQSLPVEACTGDAFAGTRIALFAAGSAVARRVAPAAVQAGAVVIDNSSAYRMDGDVPLVVPEVNCGTIAGHHGIIANPNCVAIIAALALWPLHQAFGLRRVVASTYQAASGAGAAAIEELRESTRAALSGQVYVPRVLRHPYAFNLYSHDTAVDPETGSNEEETKVMRELLAVAPGVRVVDDRQSNHFPMPLEASGQDDVLVGRVRTDSSDPSGHSLGLFVAGDQLLKGAALNAIQIAEQLLAGAG
jgi:aspartate-semialdehyde dehydrogenase